MHNHENVKKEVNKEYMNISTKQVALNKRFTCISVTETDNMENDLLKDFNAPFILFDRTIDWVKRHEGNITKNDILA